jgi:glycosyltransferase involved in cell wall biosynthesis
VTEERLLCLIGTFPPPVHGQAAVNEAVRKRVVAAGSPHVVINLAGPSLERGWRTRLKRVEAFGSGLAAFLKAAMQRRQRRRLTIYMSVSGGWGQVYEACFASVGRLLDARIFLHHHSFAYLDRRRGLTALLARVAGPEATHVVLCERMARLLQERYGAVQRVMEISNAGLVDEPPAAATPRSTLKTIAFLSNVSREKGVLRFLDVIEALRAEGSSVRARIAGPFQDPEIESTVRQRLAQLGESVEYLGARYGEEKRQFFLDADALLYPSDYVNEAEPLVIWEAVSQGLPVVAWGRGCIGQMLSDGAGAAVPVDQDFRLEAVSQVKDWMSRPDRFAQASRQASEAFAHRRRQAEAAAATLIGLLTS